jgi:ABC-2 type transport system permease protein
MNLRILFVQYRREVLSLFISPIAYVVGFCFLVVTGWSFYASVHLLNRETTQWTVMELFFSGFFIWFAQVVVMPVLTMRIFSEEYSQGTFEGLVTAPVRDWEIVIAKYLAVLTLYAAIWAPTALYVPTFRLVSLSSVDLAAGPTWCSYVMVLLMGLLFASFGLLASALTRNQVVAVILSFSMTVLFFFAGLFVYMDVSGPVREVLYHISVFDHMERFSKGLVNTRVPVFYLSLTALMLFATKCVIESRRWRA